jgi:hypothetical protein
MYILAIILPLFLSLVVQFLLWFNLLFPYNFLFENFNRNLYLAFSLSGFLGACISIVFYKMIAFEEVNKIVIIIASVLQILCLSGCIYFFLSSLTGWLVI